MNYFLQNYFKPSYFQADHLRTSGVVVEPEDTITRGGSSSRRRWMFTLPSGRVIVCSDPRVIKPLIEAEELEELLKGLQEVVLDTPESAAQDTILKAITALLVAHAEVIYESTAEALSAEMLLNQQAIVDAQQKIAADAFIQGEEVFQSNQRKREEHNALVVAQEKQQQAEAQLEEIAEEERQAMADLDTALDSWIESQITSQQLYEQKVTKQKQRVSNKVARLAVIKQLLEGTLA